MITVAVKVRGALFRDPGRWHTAPAWSRAFVRKLRVLDLFVLGEDCECRGLPVRLPLPYGRTRDVYRVRAVGVEGGTLTVHLA